MRKITPCVILSLAAVACAPAQAGDGYFFRSKHTVISATELRVSASGVRVDVGTGASPLVVSGGRAPYSWAGIGLPAGVAVSASGVVSASVAGHWPSVTVEATDGGGARARATFSLRSVAPLAAGVAGSVSVAAGKSVVPFVATGGVAPYAWSAASLPPGVSLSADGNLSASAMATSGTVGGLVATVRDAESSEATVAFSLVVSPPPGNLFAFGANNYGQSLPGSTDPVKSGPVSVGPWKDWSSVTGSDWGACGLRGGSLYCWGNAVGMVTDGPKLVGSGWTLVRGSSAQNNNLCGIQGGKLFCWGNNGNGQVKEGAGNPVAAPLAMDGGSSGWTAAASGGHFNCGIQNGYAFCWGYGAQGQLGGSTTNGSGLTRVGDGTSGWTELAGAAYAACGIQSTRLFCWGDNASGQLGANGTVSARTPQAVDGGSSGWSNLTAGQEHACALKGGVAYCWGGNSKGQVGVGGTSNVTGGPAPVGGGMSGWTSIAAGRFHTCGIRSGRLLCWGEGAYGAIGPGTSDRSLPEAVDAATDWKSVSAGNHHTLALK